MDIIYNLLGRNKDKSENSELAKYHGLVNQGATCYLNSVLQVLFMTPNFKERVKSHIRSNPDTEHIDRELSDLFIQLEGNTALTNNITYKLKINSVNEQRDAAEIYERILRLTSPGPSQMFHGELTNRYKCQKCAKVTESAAGFWNLPLPLMDSRNEFSVERAIEDFFRPSEISGDDQMYCETCDEKCDAVLDCAVKHHPEVLVLPIKRFEFDFTQRTYFKNRWVVDIPYVLNVQNHTYELYAIVEHLNEQRFGRYIATIKNQCDGRWYTFDDSNVTVSRNQYFQVDPREKSRTAYLLFYQRLTSNTYNGVLNLGATCYLNSVLQVLFMTENFKQSVTRHTRNNPRTEHIDRELGDLFSELETRCAYTYNIIKKLKINNVDEQRDAAEHYEKILRLTSREPSQIFHGELQNKNTCLKCRTQSESTTGFWHLPLSLLDSQYSYSVYTSIQDFFHREVLMYCVTCEEECVAVLECDMKHQPDVLVILLKRFEYDEKQMRNIKNNCVVDVPYTLYMPMTYELYASVEHFGELTFGHYIARIRSQDDGRWYIFDDENVSLSHHHFQEHPMERSQTAYLLFYKKQKETAEAEEATATQNTEINLEEGENAPRRVNMMSDETKTNGDVIHVKRQEIGRDQENIQEDHEETTDDGQELHLTDNPGCDVDQLVESMHKMTISDNKDSMFAQADNDIMEIQSEGSNTTLRMSESENLMKGEKTQQENIAQYLNGSSSQYCIYGNHEYQVNGFNFEDEQDKGACALSEVSIVRAYDNDNGYTGDVFADRSNELVKNTHINSCFEPGEVPGDITNYRLKMTVRQRDLDSQGKRKTIMSGDCLNDQESTGSERSEKTATPQPYRIHYPDEEDFKRVQATKIFIRNEEQMKNEEACGRPYSEWKGSELRESGGATSRDKKIVQRARGQSCTARLERVESLGVRKEGDTEILRFKPKKRQDNEQNTRHFTQV